MSRWESRDFDGTRWEREALKPRRSAWLYLVGLVLIAGVTFCAVRTGWIIYSAVHYAASDLEAGGQ